MYYNTVQHAVVHTRVTYFFNAVNPPDVYQDRCNCFIAKEMFKLPCSMACTL